MKNLRYLAAAAALLATAACESSRQPVAPDVGARYDGGGYIGSDGSTGGSGGGSGTQSDTTANPNGGGYIGSEG